MKLDVILEPSEEGGFTTIVPALLGVLVKEILVRKH